jgi:hypothetical protein
MPLPAGVWKAFVNGTESELILEFSQQDGPAAISGALFRFPIRGFWDESSQRIVFTLFVGDTAQDRVEPWVHFFEGYLFRSPANPVPGQDVVATLAGSFESSRPVVFEHLIPVQPSSRRNTFGWYAQLTEVM